MAKQLTTYTRASGYLNKIFKALNDEFFESTLSMPVITIQSTPRAYGHFTLYDAWHTNDDKKMKEINIGAGTLDRPIENLISTLLHEMVHYYCFENGIKDTSRGGTYHNKRFKQEAEKRALKIDYDARIGWSITSPTEQLIDFIIDNGFSEVLLGRDDETSYVPVGGSKGGQGRNNTNPPRKPSSTRKYICMSCRTSVRATKKVNIICADCMEMMIVADGASF